MPYFLNRILQLLLKKPSADAEIISEVKLNESHVPYFTVKMNGCKTPVDIDAEDIIEKFIDKFSQYDIKIATKMFMKYRSLLKLISIEKNYVILYNKNENRYQLIDLSDVSFFHNTDLDMLRSEDAFKIGVHFEKMRFEKDKKLFNLTKSGNNTIQLKLVKQND